MLATRGFFALLHAFGKYVIWHSKAFDSFGYIFTLSVISLARKFAQKHVKVKQLYENAKNL